VTAGHGTTFADLLPAAEVVRSQTREAIMRAYRTVFGALVVLAVAGLAAAEDREKGDRSDSGKDKSPKIGGRTYTGKIDRVDSTNRMLYLTDVGGKADRDKRSESKEKASAKATTFTISSTAVVTLDGKKATVEDLKAGQFVRARAGLSSADKGGDSADDRDKRPKGRDSDVRDRAPVLERIDAFTKEPDRERK